VDSTVLTTVFVDHAERIPIIAEITGLPELWLSITFDKAHSAGKYCRIKCELTEAQRAKLRTYLGQGAT
jgi:hypothetical protein